MRHRTSLRQSATMANPIEAGISRRSGDTFTPMLPGGQVKPNEPIRLIAGDMAGWGGEAEFVITDIAGTEVFRATATRSFFGSTAWIDTVAPATQGQYILHVAQSAFLIVHRSEFAFEVNVNAPSPPAPPPSGGAGILGDVKWIVIAIAVVVLISQAGKLIPQRKA